MRANHLGRVASTLVLFSTAMAATALPLCAQQSGQASKQPGGYAAPEGSTPLLAAVDIDPIYARPAIDTLATIRKRGVLRIGVARTEPMVMHDAKGELVGFSIDLGRKLAEDLGIRVAFVETSWSQIVPDLLGNHFDLIASGLWITPARALVVNFSESTAIEAVHLVAGKPLAGTMKTREDFNRPDVRIVVYAGTVQENIAASLFPRAQVVKVAGDEDQLAPVLDGKAHATVLTTAVPHLVVGSAPDRLFLPLDGPLQATSTALAVRKGDADFLNFLNSWLLFQRQSGFLAWRSQYWFQGRDWLNGM